MDEILWDGHEHDALYDEEHDGINVGAGKSGKRGTAGAGVCERGFGQARERVASTPLSAALRGQLWPEEKGVLKGRNWM
jgi:hypothetical protein